MTSRNWSGFMVEALGNFGLMFGKIADPIPIDEQPDLIKAYNKRLFSGNIRRNGLANIGHLGKCPCLYSF